MGGNRVGFERPKGSRGADLQQDAATNALIVTAAPGVPVPVDVTDRWARQLGQIDLARVLGAGLAAGNPVITGVYDAAGNRMPAMDVAARPGFVDAIDRAARLLGIIYGNVGQLQQAATGEAKTQDSNIPRGGLLTPGTLVTGAGYGDIISYTVTNNKTLRLSRILISATKASTVRLLWNGVQFGCERYMSDGAILIEHFPTDYYNMLGDGAKLFKIQAKQDTASCTIQGEFSGEET